MARGLFRGSSFEGRAARGHLRTTMGVLAGGFRPEVCIPSPGCEGGGAPEAHRLPRLRGAARVLRNALASSAPPRHSPGPMARAVGSAPGRASGRRLACASRPVQRAPRRAVIVPPGRSPGAARVPGYEPGPRGPPPLHPLDVPRRRPSASEVIGNIVLNRNTVNNEALPGDIASCKAEALADQERAHSTATARPNNLSKK